MRNRLLIILIVAFALAGCTAVTTSRMGHRYPPRQADCEVIWENLDMAEAAVRYDTVGFVGIGSSVGTDVETNPKLRATVKAEACKAGADAVLIGANASGGLTRARSASVLLLHKRATPPAWAAGLLGTLPAPASK